MTNEENTPPCKELRCAECGFLIGWYDEQSSGGEPFVYCDRCVPNKGEES